MFVSYYVSWDPAVLATFPRKVMLFHLWCSSARCLLLPAELFTKRDVGKRENSDTPEDFLIDQEDEKPKHSKEDTGERGEAKVDHKRGRKLKKVSGVLQSAEVMRATQPKLSEAG